METIVVGVDGSECAAAALEFAIEEARLRAARLRIVTAWQVPAGSYGVGLAPLDADLHDSFRSGAEATGRKACATAAARDAAIECEAVAAEGQPASVLLEHASDATLVVVGNRGLGGFTSLLLGSVSQQVVHHAPCPVVVVHAPRES